FYELEPVLTGENLVTALVVAPMEFAMVVLQNLDVCAPDTLHLWDNLNKTHQPEYFFQLMHSITYRFYKSTWQFPSYSAH
ncbi:UNVERIFIED_CONTAM: hypothetical protein FO527_29645, partial [Bacillus sp. ATCC 13368]